ncbi:MAG: adenylosuccinate lyase [Gammaproteobacteria bacterium]|nr:adenylosuccinate lyase [Gammaproteobacteria bacterium]
MTKPPTPTPDAPALMALSPVDGRYARKSGALRGIFSEFGLIRYRVIVEIAWLRHLAASPAIPELPDFPAPASARLDAILGGFDATEAGHVKHIEATTNHDVKAVEYYLRERFAGTAELEAAIPFIHFACTSEDINNLSYGLSLRDAQADVLVPELGQLVKRLTVLGNEYADIAMLARTHGQTASPTTAGKEFANVAHRLQRQLDQLAAQPMLGKMNGAVGNYNAHFAAYPDVDWPALCSSFVESLGLEHNPLTTQIEPHDFIAETAATLTRANTVLIDLCRDLWAYVSLGYFRQRRVDNEVGSSTMPHKINPIDFENAEGNLGVANALLGHMAAKLPISRWQRDLTDSTVLRNLGTALAHCVIAYGSLARGLDKLDIDADRIAADIDDAWEVLAEAVQTVMRKHGIADSYEQLKAMTRGTAVTSASLHEFVRNLDIPEPDKQRLLALTPATYIGNAAEQARR